MLKRALGTCCSSSTSYIDRHISVILCDHSLSLESLRKLNALIITGGYSDNIFVASKLISSYASHGKPNLSSRVFDLVSSGRRDVFLWNSIIKAHFSNKYYTRSLGFFISMLSSSGPPDHFTAPMVVSASAELLWFDVGSFLHGLFLKLGFFHLVGASFVYFYSKCGFLDDACNVFDEMPERDVVAWTAIISGHVQNGESERGLCYLCKMLSVGSDDHEKPNPRTFECGFQACVNLGALKEGRCLHGFTVKNGLASSSKTVKSSIFSFYSKSGGVPAEAYLSFRELGGDDEDIFSWTSVIASLGRSGNNIKQSFEMFWEMQNTGIHPDGVVLSCLINELGKMMLVAQGKAFHGFVIRRCFSFDGTVCNSLLSMYCRFELLSAAEKVFCRIPQGGGNKEAWNTMLKGYASVISTCSHMGAVLLGKSLHCYAVKTSLDLTISVVNSLIDLYGKMGDLTVAWRMFCEADTDIVTWNAMIASYVHCEQPDKAIALFDRMISENVKPSSVTLVTLLMACANTGSLERGQVIHRYITETEHEMNLSLSTALIDMYAKCGHLEKSRELFDAANQKDAVCWNVMISGYGMHGQVESAIELFEQMEESDVKPTGPTFLALLSACTHAGLVEKGRNLLLKMHQYDVKPNLKHYSCLVDLLSRSGNLQEAETTVMSMPFSPDGVIWGTLLSSCMTYGEFEMGVRMAERAVASDPQNDGYYIMLANMYSAAGKWEQAERAREMMRESGVGKRAGHSVV
ncbi:PREDICTED: pentatricopeptide repeat-containing protein At4g39952, mitochondrial-like [Camelina sativa]|uniref:Pentatricopeptide repeat-containing protein At4g39952, mitochondrial-like n=1 Tax=Camelina sativa TaxID=90675 RepID=A0ABM0U7H9_CAMSA|nr:PREDICTED: pentatricopeptide repeat-containing protein At4g39952, mitochondrial-like [Camelina sativa]